MFTSGDERLPEAQEPAQEKAPEQARAQGVDHAAEEMALAGAAAHLDGVETALARLDDGTFDRCEVCGSTIGQDRLLEDPLLTRCPQH